MQRVLLIWFRAGCELFYDLYYYILLPYQCPSVVDSGWYRARFSTEATLRSVLYDRWPSVGKTERLTRGRDDSASPRDRAEGFGRWFANWWCPDSPGRIHLPERPSGSPNPILHVVRRFIVFLSRIARSREKHEKPHSQLGEDKTYDYVGEGCNLVIGLRSGTGNTSSTYRTEPARRADSIAGGTTRKIKRQSKFLMKKKKKN